MADWDPFAIDEAPAEAPAATAGDGDVQVSADLRIKKAEVAELVQSICAKAVVERPWLAVPEHHPDLLWNEQTCTADDWRHKDVKLEVSEGIAYVTFNRPEENNSMNDTLGAGLNDALFALHQRPDIRVAVFTGEGRMFCAGGDPKNWQAAARIAAGEKIEGDGTTGHRIPMKPAGEAVQRNLHGLAMRALAAGAFPDGAPDIGRICAAKQWHTWSTLPQLTICLVNGSAMGGGVGMVCCCDIVIALKKAFLSLSEVKIGVIPATISPYVIAKIGKSAAARIFCTGENLSATRAKEIGMVQEVVERLADGHAMVNEIAQLVSQCGPKAVQASKKCVMSVAGQNPSMTLDLFTTKVRAIIENGEEAKAGLAATKAGKPMPWLSKKISPLH